MLDNIEIIDSMADFSAVKMLTVNLWASTPDDSKLTRLLLELGNLPNVEKLEIQMQSIGNNKPRFFDRKNILSQWENVLQGVKELMFTGERTNRLCLQMPQVMDNLETLEIR